MSAQASPSDTHDEQATSPPQPPAATADATEGSASAPAAVELLPAHTRGWAAEKRLAYSRYCQQHEMDGAPLFNQSAGAPPPSSAQIEEAVSAARARLSAAPGVDTLEARGRLIQDGDQAIADFGRGKAWINFDGAPAKTIRVAQATARVDGLVGQPYGRVWQMTKDGRLQRTDRKRGLDTALLDAAIETSKNNSQLYDTNQSQKLTMEQIREVKASASATPQDLVDLIVENSATFATKTEFSQEKYIKRKKAKHGGELSVLPVTLARMAETLFEKDIRRCRGMRPDTVAMMLSYGNVQAGTNTLVVESCGGLLLGSLLYRQQGLGYVVHAFENNQKRTEGVKRFNFSEDIQASLLHVPLDQLLAKTVPIVKPTTASGESAAAAAASAAPIDSTAAAAAAAAAGEPAGASSSSAPSVDLTGEYVVSHQVDVLMLASRYDPFSLLSSLWPYLKPSGRFVIYDEVPESLTHAHARMCQGALGGSEAAMNLILAETFFRGIQVLPNRTHPHVNMSASGGYILTGIKMHAAAAATK